MKAYHIIVKLADNEWGNELMREVARETFAAHPDLDPMAVEVREHAGWFLTYTRELTCIGTANDRATSHLSDVASFRERTRDAEWTYLPSVNRNHTSEVGASS